MRNLFRVWNMISHEWAQRTSVISFSTREINFVFPSIHVFFCLLYKGRMFSRTRSWNTVFIYQFLDNQEEAIISHVWLSWIISHVRLPFLSVAEIVRQIGGKKLTISRGNSIQNLLWKDLKTANLAKNVCKYSESSTTRANRKPHNVRNLSRDEALQS